MCGSACGWVCVLGVVGGEAGCVLGVRLDVSLGVCWVEGLGVWFGMWLGGGWVCAGRGWVCG